LYFCFIVNVIALPVIYATIYYEPPQPATYTGSVIYMYVCHNNMYTLAYNEIFVPRYVVWLKIFNKKKYIKCFFYYHYLYILKCTLSSVGYFFHHNDNIVSIHFWHYKKTKHIDIRTLREHNQQNSFCCEVFVCYCLRSISFENQLLSAEFSSTE